MGRVVSGAADVVTESWHRIERRPLIISTRTLDAASAPTLFMQVVDATYGGSWRADHDRSGNRINGVGYLFGKDGWYWFCWANKGQRQRRSC